MFVSIQIHNTLFESNAILRVLFTECLHNPPLLFKEDLFVYVCVRLHIGMGIHACVYRCMERPEVDLGCSQSLSASFFKTGLLTEPKFTKFTRLDGQQALGVLLSLPPQPGITGAFHHAQLFTWVLRIQTQGLRIVKPVLYQLHLHKFLGLSLFGFCFWKN